MWFWNNFGLPVTLQKGPALFNLFIIIICLNIIFKDKDFKISELWVGNSYFSICHISMIFLAVSPLSPFYTN